MIVIDRIENSRAVLEIDGEMVKGQLGDYWVSYDFNDYPDSNNNIEFSDINSIEVAQWLERNDWIKISEIQPEEETSFD